LGTMLESYLDPLMQIGSWIDPRSSRGCRTSRSCSELERRIRRVFRPGERRDRPTVRVGSTAIRQGFRRRCEPFPRCQAESPSWHGLSCDLIDRATLGGCFARLHRAKMVGKVERLPKISGLTIASLSRVDARWTSIRNRITRRGDTAKEEDVRSIRSGIVVVTPFLAEGELVILLGRFHSSPLWERKETRQLP
jgi:hypothetical protein